MPTLRFFRRHPHARRADQLAVDMNLALVDGLETGNRPEGRGLAAAGCAEQATDLAFGQLEAQAADYRGGFIAQVDVFD